MVLSWIHIKHCCQPEPFNLFPALTRTFSRDNDGTLRTSVYICSVLSITSYTYDV